jgi:predicted lipoprotein with Yx(FWY)xxD motif
MQHFPFGTATALSHFVRLLVGAAMLTVVTIAAASAFAAGGSAVVKVGPSNLGRVLVDAHGKTLYIWAHDKSSKSTCNGDCAEYWPPLVTKGRPQAIAGARSDLLGTSRRTDGRIQVTYAGHPLYYFVQDRKPGQTTGEGLTGFGGRWDPVSATGTAVRKGATAKAAGAYSTGPLQVNVITPTQSGRAGAGGSFNVDLSLQARNPGANALLSATNGYKPFFNSPDAPTFHPGPDPGAPGLVVLLSSTPTKAGTPLQGPNTNLAGVFQLNTVAKVRGLRQTFNAWQVSQPGFFGTGQATLTAYAVRGAAPALITTPGANAISNVARVNFTIAG